MNRIAFLVITYISIFVVGTLVAIWLSRVNEVPQLSVLGSVAVLLFGVWLTVINTFATRPGKEIGGLALYALTGIFVCLANHENRSLIILLLSPLALNVVFVGLYTRGFGIWKKGNQKLETRN